LRKRRRHELEHTRDFRFPLLSSRTKRSSKNCAGEAFFASGTVSELISNDDGIYSPGILALAEASARFGDVRIVAPDVEQFSAGHSITAWRPLTYNESELIEAATRHPLG
jgi:hypothetical protein